MAAAAADRHPTLEAIRKRQQTFAMTLGVPEALSRGVMVGRGWVATGGSQDERRTLKFPSWVGRGRPRP